MRATRPRARRVAGILVTGVAGFSLALAGTANAVTTPTEDANALAVAVGGASGALAFDYDCVADDGGTPEDESLCPTGIGDTPMAGFPTAGPTYGILTTGNAAYADDPNAAEDTEYRWNKLESAIGPDVWDAQIARIDMGAATTSCLAFDFRFLSEEYPEYVDAGFNDAFVAQLNAFNVTVDPGTQGVIAPGNFAGGAGDVISVDSGGPSGMVNAHTPVELGSTYDGATPLLTARIPVTPGTVNSVFLTLFDQGDDRLDSSVFVDNMRYEAIDAAKCKSLSLDPYDGTTGVSPVPGTTPTLSGDLSQLQYPVSCNLPPGPVSCSVNAAASFAATPGRTVSGDHRSAAVAVPLAAGSATIAPNTNGTITMATTPTGVAAVKAAIAKPGLLKAQAKKLKKKAKKLLKKAKQLREDGKIAKAKKLEKKAKKLIRRAKRLVKRANALAAQPLGSVTTTVTNTKNGVSASFTSVLPRP
jgi:hypothetical protein